MKKSLLTLLLCLAVGFSFAGNYLDESFEYGNHEYVKPVGWICDDTSWVCGYQEKDHNRIPHTGNWYAYAEGDEAWMFMSLYMIPSMKYRFSCWAVSDGDYQLEFWAGTAPDPDYMHTQLLSGTVSGGEYERFTSFVEALPDNCDYIAVHAIGPQDGFLTIDDIGIDMVEQYQFEAHAITGDTAMYPGTEAVFRFLIHNTGYDPLNVTMLPSNEYFTGFSFHSNGASGPTFSVQPDETIEVTTHATLRPEVEPGTTAWLDIHMSIPNSCNTAMVTFWVTPLDPTQGTEDKRQDIKIYPNPATDYVNIEAEDLQQVTLTDLTGKALGSVATQGNSIRLDLSGLKAGVYLISAKTRSTSSFVKSILKM